MKMIINSAMIPGAGTFSYRTISYYQAGAWLLDNWGYEDIECTSYIGYQQTADHLRDTLQNALASSKGLTYADNDSRVVIPLNRAKCSMRPGDEALVCRLAYRVENPATKGKPQAEDWEYGILQMLQAVPVSLEAWGEPATPRVSQ